MEKNIGTAEKILLRQANKSDIDFLFNLRNKNYVYKYSINANPIEHQEHLNWISPIISGEKKDRFLYVILYGKEKAGQIRFDILNEKDAEVSISILKEFHGKHIANFALEKSIPLMKEKGFKKIIAEVFEKNIASVKFFKKQEFVKVKNVEKDLWVYEYLIK